MTENAYSRKEFLKKCLSVSVISMAAYKGLAVPRKALAQSKSTLVAVRNGEPDKLFDAGIEALGGIKRFVKKGQTVCIKPNIAWNKEPHTGANTHPALVKRVIEHCYNAGAKRVYVFDNPVDYWEQSYKTSGILKAAKDAGAKAPFIHSDNYFNTVKIPDGKLLKEADVHTLVLESDVLINIPVLKHHGGASITSAMKNLMGVVFDRRVYHRNGLHQCIADFCTWRQPDLNILDAYTMMMTDGPQGDKLSDLVIRRAQLLSTDMVAMDVAAASLMNLDPAKIDHIKFGSDMGLGEFNLDNVDVKKIVL